MEEIRLPKTAQQLASAFDAVLVGDGAQTINQLGSLNESQAGTLCFLSDKKYISELSKLSGGVVLIKKDWVLEELPLTYILVDDPKRVFARIAKQFSPKSQWQGISDLAYIDPSAEVDPSAKIAPYAVVGAGAKVGAETVIFPHAVVGAGCIVGQNCEIHSHVSLVAQVSIGNRVRIFSGSVLGSEGFGYLESGGVFTEMPQIGWVVIEDDVRIGAKCTIDRGTLGETRVGKGSKLDDHVHVGHNSRIGKNCILCGQACLAGSTVLEDDVMLGGQVALAGHMTVGKGARLAGQTGASTNLKAGETYMASPAMPIREAIRVYKYTRKLASLFERVKKLEEGFDAKS